MKLAVFISGNGSNLEAIINGCKEGIIDGEVVLVVSNKDGVYGLERARRHNIPTYIYRNKDESLLVPILKEYGVDFIALAGFMQLIGETLLSTYPNMIINIHPALLPDYKGLHAIERATADGAKVMGVTIHYVDDGMDTGAIIAQSSFRVEEGMTAERIEEEIHKLEHQLYPEVLGGFSRGEYI